MDSQRNDVPGVTVTDVDFSYGSGRAKKQVLFGCSLHLSFGELVIMTGPSGSGKTTLLTLIGGLRSLQLGSIRVGSLELRGMPTRRLDLFRRQIGFIFQDHNLFDSLSAGQTLRLAMRLFPGRYTRKELRERPLEMLEALGMGEYLHARPDEISTGQKQRVAIARALMNHPKIILADEPTASLDKETGRVVIDLLRERAIKNNALVLIVSHDQRLFEFSDQVVRVVDGRVLANEDEMIAALD